MKAEVKKNMSESREAVMKALEYLEANPTETPKYFSHLEARIEAFFGEDGEDGIDLVKRTGKLMEHL